jgi:hypothetical protein
MSTAKSVPANSSSTPSATRLFNSVLSATVPKSCHQLSIGGPRCSNT